MKLRTLIGLFVLAAGLFVIAAQNADGRPAGVKKAAKQMNDAQLITALQAQNKILGAANGNYQGHRAAAFHQIQKAVVALAKEARLTVKKQTLTTNKEGQALSDAQLKQVIADLKAVITAINGLRATKQRTLAVEAIEKAIGELKIALTIN
jgi:hypothetical protein